MSNPIPTSSASSRRARLVWLCLPAVILAPLVLVAASAHVVAQEPIARQDSSEAVGHATPNEWVGRSVLRIRGACIEDETCVGDVTHEDGSFFLNAPAGGGRVTVSWRAVNESLATLRIRIAGIEVVSESPIHLSLDGLAAGEHKIRVEPAGQVVGVHDQVVDWTARFSMNAPFETIETRGRSSYHIVAACALGACDPLTSFSSDKLIVPWRAEGTMTVTWDPQDEPRRVTIPGTGFRAEGLPPLELDVSGLAEGEWNVRLEPASVSAPLSEASVSWLAQLARQQLRGDGE